MELVRDLVEQRRELDGFHARRLLARACAREREQCPCEPGQPGRFALDVREKPVALGRVVLGARLEHFDGADDRRERRA